MQSNMTEGELIAKKLPDDISRIKRLALPLSILGTVICYFGFGKNMIGALIVFPCFLLTAWDEYHQRYKILSSEDKLNELKAIVQKRKAQVFVNGGAMRELKHFLVIAGVIALYFYVK